MKKLDLIDMHTHTCYSDGELTPNELVRKAEKEGIGTIAITDHDTLLGVKNMTIPENKRKTKVINGIEISVKVPIGRMHILGYDIDIYDQRLNDKMTELHNRSLYSVSGIICQLKKDYNIVFTTEDILQILNKTENIGRPDIAKLLIKYGYASSVQEAFQKYLIDAYKNCGNITKGISEQDSISIIKEAGGLAVLAHPNSLEKTPEELEIMIKKLKEYGLDGIEVYHSNHSFEDTQEYLKIAQKYDLLISGGSDYHGPLIKPDIQLAKGKDNIKIKKLTLLDTINNR